jgi:hypothetical protein
VVVAGVLGQVVRTEHQRGNMPDPRIASALLQMVNARLSDGTASVAEPMAALAEVAAIGRIENANLLMVDVLDRAAQEDAAERDQMVIWTAARVLLVNEGDMAMNRLRVRIRDRAETDALRRAVERAIEAYDTGRAIAL